MSSYLIIDGYNIINKWPNLIQAKEKSIEFARSELFYIIQKYADAKDLDAVIVYDGRASERSLEKGNPTVIYSKRSETADTVIESLVYNFTTDKNQKSGLQIRVVTGDRIISNMVLGMGAAVSSPEIFASELKTGIQYMREGIKNQSSDFKRGLGL